MVCWPSEPYRGGASGVAEVQAGVDILGVIGDGLCFHTLLIVHAVDSDLRSGCDQLVEGGFGVVLALQRDACAVQRVGHGAEHHLDRVLLAVSRDADGKRALDVQCGKVAAVGRVIDLIAFFGLDAGEVHDLCGVGLGGEDHLPGTIGVCDVGQPQIRSGHTKRSHKAHDHDTERQHTGRDCFLAVRECFLQFYGSDTRQLLSFRILSAAADRSGGIGPAAGLQSTQKKRCAPQSNTMPSFW